MVKGSKPFGPILILTIYLLNPDIRFRMKKITKILSSILFMVLVSGFIQYASADHSLGGQGIFKDETRLNLVSSIDSKYQIHLQVIVRNVEDQLVSVSEAMSGKYIPHSITDHVFDNMAEKKEVVIIDKIKYEKVQRTNTYDVQQFPFPTSYQDVQVSWKLELEADVVEHGRGIIPIFEVYAPLTVESSDTLTFYWTILREMN